jgi:hypothetical protein
MAPPRSHRPRAPRGSWPPGRHPRGELDHFGDEQCLYGWHLLLIPKALNEILRTSVPPFGESLPNLIYHHARPAVLLKPTE